MLRSLYIQNYALIEKLDIDFGSGFSVITGETGAGKSIILGAIGLLLGQRADVKSIRRGAAKCVIEARFEIAGYGMQPFFEENELEYEDECILRREVYASGKSRAFINDTPASLVQMKELGEQLIDVHSQHQNLLLNKEGFQLSVLDLLAHDEDELSKYRSLHREWKQVQQDLEHLVALAEKNKADEDYIRFQLEQLEDAHLATGEQEELEQEADTLSHAEEIKAGLFRAGQAMNSDEGGLLSVLKECLNTMAGLQKVYPAAGELAERLESSYIELKDISQEISGKEEEIEFNPGRLEEVNGRLNLIYTLQQKHRVASVSELLALQARYEAQLADIEGGTEAIAQMRQQVERLRAEAVRIAGELTAVRTAAAPRIEEQIAGMLAELGMESAVLRIEIAPAAELRPDGADTIRFLFTANRRMPLQPVEKVASGGEMSRLMLSLKSLVARSGQLPTVIFDEIDTGVSGSVADRMGEIIVRLSSGLQVINITHLPQVAAKGSDHFFVYKEESASGTATRIRKLAPSERVEQIARMLSGTDVTEAAREQARLLLGDRAC